MRSKTPGITASTTCRRNCCRPSWRWSTTTTATALRLRWMCAARPRCTRCRKNCTACAARAWRCNRFFSMPPSTPWSGAFPKRAAATPSRTTTRNPRARRFPEPPPRHQLSHDDPQQERKALVQIIDLERELLADLREASHVIDTSQIRASQLQSYVKSLMPGAQGQLTLVFQSFAFKRGIPMDADYVFDVRMLANPYYEPALRELTGLDEPVADFLQLQPDVDLMRAHIEQFLAHWLELLDRNHRSYVTVAIGCTGGQHRSVYLVERLAQSFGNRWTALKRHRELDGRQ